MPVKVTLSPPGLTPAPRNRPESLVTRPAQKVPSAPANCRPGSASPISADHSSAADGDLRDNYARKLAGVASRLDRPTTDRVVRVLLRSLDMSGPATIDALMVMAARLDGPAATEVAGRAASAVNDHLKTCIAR